jgi:hypothetical protein
MLETKIDPDNDLPVEAMAKIQEALKPLGYVVRGYNENRGKNGTNSVDLHLEHECRFVQVPI